MTHNIATRSRRKALKMAVCSLCQDAGFGTAEDSVLETLTEMLQTYISEAGRSCRAYCELAGRTEAMVSDVVMTLIEMGSNISSIAAYAKRSKAVAIHAPSVSNHTPTAKTLQTGDKQAHPPYIPEHLPAFPDPHTYIRTLTQKQPVNEYQLIREKAASQKRDVERALTRFIAKTGDTHSLFKEDTTTFPLIAIRMSPLPYLNGLLPKDQDLDAQEPTEILRSIYDQNSVKSVAKGDSTQTPTTIDSGDADAIDNPYLRPVKIPRIKKKAKYY